MAFSERDLAYIRANYVTLDELCASRQETPAQVRALIEQGRLPRPSYLLDDGVEMVPPDYFRLVDEAGGPDDLRAIFSQRYYAAGGKPEEFAEDWQGYMDGTYGVCLRDVIPETIVRKSELVVSVSELLDQPRSDDQGWRAQLREQVDELNVLERQFSPDYDRGVRFAELPSRDRLIDGARSRFPDVFAEGVGARAGAVAGR